MPGWAQMGNHFWASTLNEITDIKENRDKKVKVMPTKKKMLSGKALEGHHITCMEGGKGNTA